MEDSKLLEDILTLDEHENGGEVEPEPSLVDIYQDLILMTESLKSGIEKLLEKEGPSGDDEEEGEDSDENDSEDEENNESDDDEDESDKSGDEEVTEVSFCCFS